VYNCPVARLPGCRCRIADVGGFVAHGVILSFLAVFGKRGRGKNWEKARIGGGKWAKIGSRYRCVYPVNVKVLQTLSQVFP
jgi:hypothetical protein